MAIPPGIQANFPNLFQQLQAFEIRERRARPKPPSKMKTKKTKSAEGGIIGSLLSSAKRQKELDELSFGERFKKVFFGGTLTQQEITQIQNQLSQNGVKEFNYLRIFENLTDNQAFIMASNSDLSGVYLWENENLSPGVKRELSILTRDDVVQLPKTATNIFGRVSKKGKRQPKSIEGEGLVFKGGKITFIQMSRLNELATQMEIKELEKFDLKKEAINMYINLRDDGLTHIDSLTIMVDFFKKDVKPIRKSGSRNLFRGGNISQEAFCLKCRFQTGTRDGQITTSKNNRKVFKGKCAVCGIGKAKFIS